MKTILLVDQKNHTNSSLKKILSVSGLDLGDIEYVNGAQYVPCKLQELALIVAGYKYVISTGALSGWAVGQCKELLNIDHIVHVPLIYLGSTYQVHEDSYLFEEILKDLKSLKEVVDVAKKNTLSVME
jgi:hypothetical protein